MQSFNLEIDKRRRTYVRLIGEIQHALNQALTEEHTSRNLTKAQIATLLGKNKSFVTRKLSGSSNMTLETLADLAWALNRPVRVSLPSSGRAGDNSALPATETQPRNHENNTFIISQAA